jgi:type I restriction enzyme S subunit
LKRCVATKITDGPHETPELVDERIDFISAEAVQDGRIDFSRRRGFISPELHRLYCRKCRPRRGDLFMCKSGATTGKLAMVETDMEFSVWSPLAQIRCDDSLAMPKFMYFALHAEYVQSQIRRTWSAGTQPNISMGDIEQLLVVAPPLPEQQAIAAFLDRETAKIDALVEKKRRLIELLKEKRAALISHAVTKGLNPDLPMKDSGIEWLGEVPRRWKLPPLYARYRVELGKMLDAKRITGDYLLPYLRNIDVQWDHVNVSDLPEMDIEPDEYERFTLRHGDLLVCEGGEVGRTAIWRSELATCAFQKAIHRLRPVGRISSDVPRYLYYVMRCATESGIFVAAGDPNTIPHLTAEKLRLYRFPFPPGDEQQAIVEYLDEDGQKSGLLISRVETAIDRLLEYRTALISAAVTGKIDVRGEM